MENLKLKRPIAFFDIESTGTDVRHDRIVEVSVIKIYPDGKEKFLTSVINPLIPIPPESTVIHGLKDEDVKGKPTFREFSGELQNFLDGCDFGGFNIKRFDLPLLENEFERNNISYSHGGRLIVDVMGIYHKFNPRDLIAAYKSYCGKDLDGAHRSEEDVKATLEVFKAQLEKHNLPDSVEEIHNFLYPKDPNWIDSEGKFVWSGDNPVFNFGGNKGKTLTEVFSKNKEYFAWMINQNFPKDTEKIARDALRGIFPEK